MGSAIMWAWRSAYRNVKKGNLVMGWTSPWAGMAREAFQYQCPVGMLSAAWWSRTCRHPSTARMAVATGA
jgi:hypothetical protein